MPVSTPLLSRALQSQFFKEPVCDGVPHSFQLALNAEITSLGYANAVTLVFGSRSSLHQSYALKLAGRIPYLSEEMSHAFLMRGLASKHRIVRETAIEVARKWNRMSSAQPLLKFSEQTRDGLEGIALDASKVIDAKQGRMCGVLFVDARVTIQRVLDEGQVPVRVEGMMYWGPSFWPTFWDLKRVQISDRLWFFLTSKALFPLTGLLERIHLAIEEHGSWKGFISSGVHHLSQEIEQLMKETTAALVISEAEEAQLRFDLHVFIRSRIADDEWEYLYRTRLKEVLAIALDIRALAAISDEGQRKAKGIHVRIHDMRLRL